MSSSKGQRGLTPVPASPNTFCGPTAIAALTGIEVGRVEAAVKEYRTRVRPPRHRLRLGVGVNVRTMWSSEVIGVLAILGWKPVEVNGPVFLGRSRANRPTFAGWQRTAGDGLWLVLFLGHFVAVHRRRRNSTFVDPQNSTPIPLRTAPYRRKRVAYAWRIEPHEQQ